MIKTNPENQLVAISVHETYQEPNARIAPKSRSSISLAIRFFTLSSLDI